MHAVNAYTEESGALLVGEGIETPATSSARVRSAHGSGRAGSSGGRAPT